MIRLIYRIAICNKNPEMTLYWMTYNVKIKHP